MTFSSALIDQLLEKLKINSPTTSPTAIDIFLNLEDPDDADDVIPLYGNDLFMLFGSTRNASLDTRVRGFQELIGVQKCTPSQQPSISLVRT